MKISEIFYSLQGEGTHTGKAAVFIRFYDCNLNCTFCDEPLHKSIYEEFDLQKIIDSIKNYPSRFVILTGGEPSLRDINPLIQELQEKRYYVAVETNGYSPSNIRSADWVTYSPKNWSDICYFEEISEIKLVVNVNSDPNKIDQIQSTSKKPVFLQPQAEDNKIIKKNANYCVNLVKINSALRLSLQIHKLLNIS